MKVIIAFLIPFIGTALGAAAVFFMKSTLSLKTEKLLSGVAAGVMCAASVWSLIIPALETGKNKYHSLFICVAGFVAGVLLLIITQKIVGSLEKAQNLSKNFSLIFAVTLHNIPEGLAVGVCFAKFLSERSQASFAAALALSTGIAIQNFPEGAIISMPLKSEGKSKLYAFIAGALSGIVEPLAALLTLAVTAAVIKQLPFLLCFAAGAMIFVSVDELIPDSKQKEGTNIGAIGFITGFLLMMALDVAFG